MIQARNLYIIGKVVMDCPMGLNPQDALEGFGGDFAIKPVVGARPNREFVGPSDSPFTLSGTIFPFRYAAAGGSPGQAELATLREYAEAGEPLPIMRGDGVNMGFFVIERGQIHHTRLAITGIGRVQEFALQLTKTEQGPSREFAVNLFTGLISLLSQIGQTPR